jgi:hypothetical protein
MMPEPGRFFEVPHNLIFIQGISSAKLCKKLRNVGACAGDGSERRTVKSINENARTLA